MGAPTPDETILGILAANPQHGYQLLEHFNQPEKLGRVWSMSTSQVYAVLKRLEAEDLVVGEIVVVKDAPARTEYTITLQGRHHLDAWLTDPSPSPSIRRVRIDFLSKLYVANLLGVPANHIIQYQRESCQALKGEIEERKTASGSTATDALLADFVLGQLQAAIDWLDELERQYTQGKTNGKSSKG
jgi:DNA-binding PadR family transcriptional regulator